MPVVRPPAGSDPRARGPPRGLGDRRLGTPVRLVRRSESCSRSPSHSRSCRWSALSPAGTGSGRDPLSVGAARDDQRALGSSGSVPRVARRSAHRFGYRATGPTRARSRCRHLRHRNERAGSPAGDMHHPRPISRATPARSSGRRLATGKAPEGRRSEGHAESGPGQVVRRAAARRSREWSASPSSTTDSKLHFHGLCVEVWQSERGARGDRAPVRDAAARLGGQQSPMACASTCRSPIQPFVGRSRLDVRELPTLAATTRCSGGRRGAGGDRERPGPPRSRTAEGALLASYCAVSLPMTLLHSTQGRTPRRRTLSRRAEPSFTEPDGDVPRP